jgi:hypothetical protein
MVYGLYRAGSGQRQLAGTCECGNKPSIKYGEFLDQLLKKECVSLSKQVSPPTKYRQKARRLLVLLSFPKDACVDVLRSLGTDTERIDTDSHYQLLPRPCQ